MVGFTQYDTLYPEFSHTHTHTGEILSLIWKCRIWYPKRIYGYDFELYTL